MVIANIYFYETDSIKQYLDDGIVELFETKLGLSKDLGKDYFITKIVPVLVFCDASIITTRSEQVLSYEISVGDKQSFLSKVEALVTKTKELVV